jgi:16S rRNA (cytosine1402-N4)-methyltransferase
VPDGSPETPAHQRRRRYRGSHPRGFDEKYKEHEPARYPAEVQKVRASGKTPAGSHVPIMVPEVLSCLRPGPGDVAVDCTLGGGGHALAILAGIVPGGRLIGLDVDPLELPRAEARIRNAGFGPETFIARHGTFAGLPQALAAGGFTRADVIFADLGVSSMQLDDPGRGFSYKGVGPLDMRMNPARGETAAQLVARLSESDLATLLDANADEPHAARIAAILKQRPLETTHAADRLIRAGLAEGRPVLDKSAVKMSIRRTFQALRVAVNDEFSALDALLRVLPDCLAAGGRVAILTFHSGEDRRVKKAFQLGRRERWYAQIAEDVIRPTKAETFANRRASSAKLRWAVRASIT